MPFSQFSHVPGYGTWIVGIGRTKGISCSFKNIFVVRMFLHKKSHFGFIYYYCEKQFNKENFPINVLILYKSCNQHAEYNQNKTVPPSEFNSFNGFIKNFLQLVYGFNLHTYTCFLLSGFIIASQCLKSHLLNAEIFIFLGYSCKKSSALRLKLR